MVLHLCLILCMFDAFHLPFNPSTSYTSLCWNGTVADFSSRLLITYFFTFWAFYHPAGYQLDMSALYFLWKLFVSDILELYCSLCWTGIFILFFFGNFLITFEHILNSSCQLVYENIFHIFLFSLKIFKIPIISSSKIQYLLHKKTLKSWT